MSDESTDTSEPDEALPRVPPDKKLPPSSSGGGVRCGLSRKPRKKTAALFEQLFEEEGADRDGIVSEEEGSFQSLQDQRTLDLEQQLKDEFEEAFDDNSSGTRTNDDDYYVEQGEEEVAEIMPDASGQLQHGKFDLTGLCTNKQEIGSGAHGTTYKARPDGCDYSVAVKVMDVGRKHQARQEVDIMLRMQPHRNIVRFPGFGLVPRHLNTVCVVMELAACDLSQLSCFHGGLDEETAKCFIADVVRALVSLHACGIIHRDIKGANILLFSDGAAKVADFGVSVQLRLPAVSTCGPAGTRDWQSPENLYGEDYGTQTDIYSLGRTVIEIVSGSCRPNDGCLEQIWPQISDGCRDFLFQCLRRDPARRATAVALLDHPWLRGVNSAAPSAAAALAVEIFSQRKQIMLERDLEPVGFL